MSRAISGWSWEENLDARQRMELAQRIVAELNKRLHAPAGRRLYAVTVHPVLSRHLERALDALKGEGDLRKVARQERSDAYVTSDPGLFARILPTVFWLGPPEVSVLAFIEDPSTARNEVGNMVTTIVERGCAANGDAACMGFDSGDLVRITEPVEMQRRAGPATASGEFGDREQAATARPDETMPDRPGRVVPTARRASMILLAFGLVWTVLAGQMCLAAAWAATPAVLVSSDDGLVLTMGIGLCLAGLFGFWAGRAPRTDIFKGSAIALTVVFAPLALAAAPVSYAALCGLLLRASGYERCTAPELVRAYTTGSGRTQREFEVFAHPRDGGCAATLARLRWWR